MEHLAQSLFCSQSLLKPEFHQSRLYVHNADPIVWQINLVAGDSEELSAETSGGEVNFGMYVSAIQCACVLSKSSHCDPNSRI